MPDVSAPQPKNVFPGLSGEPALQYLRTGSASAFPGRNILAVTELPAAREGYCPSESDLSPTSAGHRAEICPEHFLVTNHAPKPIASPSQNVHFLLPFTLSERNHEFRRQGSCSCCAFRVFSSRVQLRALLVLPQRVGPLVAQKEKSTGPQSARRRSQLLARNTRCGWGRRVQQSGVFDEFPTAEFPQGSPGLSLGFNRRAPRPPQIIAMPERNSCSRLLRLRSRGICLIYNKQFSRRELCTRSKAWTLSETLTRVSKSRDKSRAISDQASAAFRRARPVVPVQAGSLLSAARNREVQSRRQPYPSSQVLSASPAQSWAPATPHVPGAGASGAASQGSAQGPRHRASSTAVGSGSPRYLC